MTDHAKKPANPERSAAGSKAWATRRARAAAAASPAEISTSTIKAEIAPPQAAASAPAAPPARLEQTDPFGVAALPGGVPVVIDLADPEALARAAQIAAKLAQGGMAGQGHLQSLLAKSGAPLAPGQISAFPPRPGALGGDLPPLLPVEQVDLEQITFLAAPAPATIQIGRHPVPAPAPVVAPRPGPRAVAAPHGRAALAKAPSLTELNVDAAAFAEAGTSPATRRAYHVEWVKFHAWCDRHGRRLLPTEPADLARYITELAKNGSAVATIEKSLAAISRANTMQGYPSPRHDPIVRDVRRGIRREMGRPARQKAPIRVAALRMMVATFKPDTLDGLRNRAILLVGWAGAMRRSEIVGITIAQIEWQEEGVVITLGRSKTDQEGKGQIVAIARGKRPETCPVRALQLWIAAAKIMSGPVFRALGRSNVVSAEAIGPREVARIVKLAAARAGLDPKAVAGHSLRSGHATEASRQGRSDKDIQAQLRHAKMETTQRYIRRAKAIDTTTSKGIGL
ncbi:MAG: site-specific integrase [Kofleriaceae bacterium]